MRHHSDPVYDQIRKEFPMGTVVMSKVGAEVEVVGYTLQWCGMCVMVNSIFGLGYLHPVDIKAIIREGYGEDDDTQG